MLHLICKRYKAFSPDYMAPALIASLGRISILNGDLTDLREAQ